MVFASAVKAKKSDSPPARTFAPQPALSPSKQGRASEEFLRRSSFGNQAMLRRPATEHGSRINNELPPTPLGLQAKLAIGNADDPLEREADHVAEQVMRMPDPSHVTHASPPVISRKCAACDEEDAAKVRTKPAGATTAQGEAPAAVHDVLRTPGQPLAGAARAFFEPRFGQDFSDVRVHSDAAAADSARAVGALGYTVGRHIVFAGGRFVQDTDDGRRLIAHELTHTVQQRGSGIGQAYLPSIQRQPAASSLGNGDAAIGKTSEFSALGLTPDPTHRLLSEDEKARIDRFLRVHQVVLIRDQNRAWLDGQSVEIDSVISQVRRESDILLADTDVIASYIDTQFFRTPLQLQKPDAIQKLPPELASPSAPTSVPDGTDMLHLTLPSSILTEEETNRLQRSFESSHLSRFTEQDPDKKLIEPFVYYLNDIRTPRPQIVGVMAEAAGLRGREAAVDAEMEAYFEEQQRRFGKVPDQPQSVRPNLKDTYSTAVNWAWHVRADKPSVPLATPRDTAIQLQFTRGNDTLQAIYQLSYNGTTTPPQVQNLVGGQVTGPEAKLAGGMIDINSIDNATKTLVGAQPFIQILGGVAQTGEDASGTAWVLQPSAGAQITIHFDAIRLPHGLEALRNFQLVLQGAVSVTAQGGQDSTVEGNITPQISFTIPGS